MAAKLQGRVTNVSDDDLGSSLDGDHAAGATSLKVQNAADFDEDGGILVINDQQIVYTSCNDDTDTITLAEGLAAAADDGDTVSVWDTLREVIAVDKHAEVDVGPDYADDIEATVSLHLVAHLEEGPRGDDDGESVVLELDEEDDEWKVVEILGLGGQGASGTLFWQDAHAVTSPGDQVFDLEHQPIDNSEHLYWNGIYQPGNAWSRSGKAVTVSDPSSVLAIGDQLVVEYAYRKGGAAAAAVPFLSPGWKYLVVPTTDAGDRSAPGYDDSAFSIGTAPFGDTATAHPSGWPLIASPVWPTETDLWLRRLVSVPRIGPVEVTVRVDNVVVGFYWNGSLIPRTGVADGANVFEIPEGDVAPSNTLAIRLRDELPTADRTYADVQVIGGN